MQSGERESYLREILLKVLDGEEEYSSYLSYAFSLYPDEIIKIAQEEGLDMTLIERNTLYLMERFNLKERFILEGEKKGEQRGKIEGKIEDARKMLEKGLEVDFISEITGLSCDDIIALKESD